MIPICQTPNMSKSINTNASAEARKRLLRDLKEIHSHPLENVTASPVSDNNMFIWHANLRGVDSEMKEIFHFMLEFPATYPLNPPAVTLCTPLPHPNVFPAKNGKGYSLCMDMLEQGAWSEDIDKNVQYSGWSTSYSVQLVLVQLQSFLLDAQLQYATQKGTLTDALAKAKSFSCTVCSHKPSAPFPAFVTPQQLVTRTVVTVHKFVPKPRAQHMYPPQPRAPRLAVAPIATPTPAKSTSTTTITTITVKTTATAQVNKLTATTPTQPATPTLPPVPAKPEWVLVRSRRSVTTVIEDAKKMKKDKKGQSEQVTTQIPSSNGKPIANGKSVVSGKPVANGKPEVDGKPKKQFKKSNTIIDKWAKSGSIEALEDIAEKAPKSVPAAKYVADNVPAYKKDYVKLMLQDAEEREAMLRERRLRDEEEEKKERQRLRRQEKKAAKRMNVSKAPLEGAGVAKANGQPAEVLSNGKEDAPKKKQKVASKVQVAVETPQPEEHTEEQKKATPAKVEKSSWADDDSWEAQMPHDKSQSTTTTVPLAPTTEPLAPTPAPAPKTDLPPPTLTFQQLREKVHINHDKLGTLSALPMDILLNTLSFLSTAQVSRVSQVSTDFHKVAESGILWRELFSKHYPKSKLTAGNIADWKYVFMREVDHIVDELVCYHTKHTFEEDVLGIPINFSVNPKTEKVDYVSSSLDILSLTAFNKHQVRISPYKQPFTHFLPLYISEDHFQRALPDIKRLLVALSPEYRTTGFSPNMALTALPKLMNTMIVLVMDGGLTASIKALTGYFAFHRLLLAFIELYPQLMVEVNNSITEFIKNENARVKSEIPSIGDWIPLISVSNKYTWHHVAKAVIGETFDRNVIWICKQDPTLATLADVNKANQNNNNANTKPGVEQHRLDKSFEASLVSQKLILFHVYFLTRVARPPGTSLVQVADNYDRYFGRPNSRELDMFQRAVKKISTLRGWPDFFFLAGIPCPAPAALTTMLRENVRNSKKKKYHDDRTNFRNIQASGTSVILKKGDNFSAPSTLNKVVMGLGWGCVGGITFLDASCFECAKSGKSLEVVDFSNTNNKNSSVVHSGDVVDYEKLSVEHTINVTLDRLRPDTEILMFTITAYTAPTLEAAGKLPWVRLSDGVTNQELCRVRPTSLMTSRYVLENTGDYTAVMMCMMKKNVLKKCWDLKVLAKLDHGRATGYTPLRANMEKFLANGVPDT